MPLCPTDEEDDACECVVAMLLAVVKGDWLELPVETKLGFVGEVDRDLLAAFSRSEASVFPRSVDPLPRLALMMDPVEPAGEVVSPSPSLETAL